MGANAELSSGLHGNENRRRSIGNICIFIPGPFSSQLHLRKTNMAGNGKSPCLIRDTTSFMVVVPWSCEFSGVNFGESNRRFSGGLI